ncbi:MAG: hypothetical protein K0Q79_581 [Flavipsychrobacter sp.]|jgi:hypothetical protein|nr:hypothetical protein [Flavipsychrobacter sp.]
MNRRRYLILFLGFALIWGIYFGVRVYQYRTGEIAEGTIERISQQEFVVNISSRRLGGTGPYKSIYPCPEIRFFYKLPGTADGDLYIVRPRALAFKEYIPGEKASVIFPKGWPEAATIYSFSEFWCTTPYMIMLGVITLFWSIGFFVVVFKPWG